MAESSPEDKSSISPMPDILDTTQLGGWMKSYIVRAPKGYDAMKHPDGTPFGLGEQIDAYIKQVVDVIEFMKERNNPEKDYQDIKQDILRLTQPEQST